MAPESGVLLKYKVSLHPALAGQAQAIFRNMRRKLEPPLFHGGDRTYRPLNLQGTSAASTQATAIELPRRPIVGRHIGLE